MNSSPIKPDTEWEEERPLLLKGFRQPKRGLWVAVLPKFKSPLPGAIDVVGILGLVLAVGLFHATALLPFALMPLFGALQVIDISTAPGTRRGDEWYTAFEKVNENFADLDALQSKTINAGSRLFDAPTVEESIQLAINYAGSINAEIVYIPASMLPFDPSLISYNDNIRLTREGGDSSVYDILAYGADPKRSLDSTLAIQAAINGAANNATAILRGGITYAPTGTYKVTATLVLPIARNDQSVILRGSGKRASTLVATGPASNFTTGVVQFGAAVPEASGTSNLITQYCGMEDIGVSGSGLTGVGSAVGIQMTETQRCWLDGVLVQQFGTGSSIGIYLLGSTTTGLGAAAPPHCWRCLLINVDSVTSMRPMVCNNVDETDVINCNLGLPPGLATPGLVCLELMQFHNLRFFGLLLSGSNDANRPNYIGLKMDAPVNGDCIGLSMYGVVAEGFDYAFYFAGGNGQDVWIYHIGVAESSLGVPGVRKIFYNGNDDGGNERRNNVHLFIDGSAQPTGVSDYHTSKMPSPETLSLVLNGGGTFSPSVCAGNVFATSTNTPGSTIISFANAAVGQPFWVRLDANVTVADSNFGGGGDIRCLGRQNIVGGADIWAQFVRLAGVTYQIGLANYDSLSLAQAIPDLVKTNVGGFGGNMVATPYRVENVLFKDSNKSTSGTSDASITSFTYLSRTLFNNNESLRITVRGRQATQAGSFNVKFGSTVLATVAIAAGENWEVELTITRTGSAAELVNGRSVHGTTIAIIAAQPTEALQSGNVTLDFRGSVTSGGTLFVDTVTVEHQSST